MIWVFVAALTLCAIGLLAMSLRTGGQADEESDATSAIFADQLAELDRDVARGVVSASDADAARVEIKRNILRQVRSGGRAVSGKKRAGRLGLMVALIAMPIFSIGYYSQFGNPGLSGIAVSDQREAREERQRVIALTSQLKSRLEADASGGPSDGWMLLGQTYMRLGSFEEAASAFSIVSKRPEADSAVFSMLAEALIAKENGIVTPAADKAIDEAAERDAANPAVTFYRALSLQQSGQSAAAHDLIVARLEAADGFYPWMEALIGQANRIGAGIGRDPISLAQFAPMAPAAGPTAEDVEAASELTAEERGEFIRSMVERLAQRLEDEPGDLDGWLRLGRAYSVLGDTEGAVKAYQAAANLSDALPADDPRKSVAQKALEALSE